VSRDWIGERCGDGRCRRHSGSLTPIREASAAIASWSSVTRRSHRPDEIVFSIAQRKVLSPNDFDDLDVVVETRCNHAAEPFQWKFTTIRRAHSAAAKRIQETSAQVDEMHDEFSDLIEKIEQG